VFLGTIEVKVLERGVVLQSIYIESGNCSPTAIFSAIENINLERFEVIHDHAPVSSCE
jgi:hypothetical protein